MEVLWEQGPSYAKDIVDILAGRIGWNKNTTYTVIKKCMEKGAIERSEPGFLCTPQVTREEVAKSEKGYTPKFLREELEADKIKFVNCHGENQ